MNRIIYTRIIYTGAITGLLLGSVGLATTQPLPPEKQAIEDQYDKERAAGAQNPAPRNPNAPYPIVHDPPFQTGIIECSAGIAGGSSEEFTVQGCWQGIVNGVKTRVYTGAEGSALDPQQGIVIVAPRPVFPAEGNRSRVLTPVKGGAVGIVAAQDNILTLVTETGSYVLTFDVNTRTFTSVVVDKTAPVIAGMPGAGCMLWPPNHKLVQVATVTVSDETMVAPGKFKVTATSNQPILFTDPKDPDIVITPTASGGYTVQLRADRLGSVATDRIYTIEATARDVARNVATVTATCTVPHDQGR